MIHIQDFLVDLFGNFGRIIVFFHVVSAALLIGSMAGIRLFVKPMLADISDEKLRCMQSLKIFRRYAYVVIAIMLVIFSASFMMNVGLGFEYANPIVYSMIYVKQFLWFFMSFNFFYMYIKFRQSSDAAAKMDFYEANENITVILDYLLPLNLVLSFIALYIGIVIRGY